MSDSVLLLLDCINDIVHKEGKLGAGGYAAQVAERGVLEGINQVTGKARTVGVPVIWVRVGFSPDYRECPAGSPLFGAAQQYGALQLGTWATAIHPDLHMTEGDFVSKRPVMTVWTATA